MKRKFSPAYAALLLGLSLSLGSLAACSGPAATAAESSAAAPTSEAAADTTAAAATEDEVTQAAPPRALRLLLDWTPNTNHSGFYVARALGYYAEEGIALDIQQAPEAGVEALVAAGQAEFGISFQDSIAPAYAKADPLPVTAVAALVNHNTSGIISLKEKGITSPKGLEGKNYATWGLPVEQAMLRQVMEADGGDFAKLELIPSTVTDVLSALQTNIDSVWIFYGWDGVAAERAGLETNYWSFADIDPVLDYYSPTLIAGDALLEAEPEVVRAFLRATARGYQYAIEQPEEAAKILLEAAPELDAELVKASQAWLSAQYIGDGSRWGYIDPARWNAFYAWLWEMGLLEQEIPPGKGFSNDYLPG